MLPALQLVPHAMPTVPRQLQCMHVNKMGCSEKLGAQQAYPGPGGDGHWRQLPGRS
jgi:hypothetical protein